MWVKIHPSQILRLSKIMYDFLGLSLPTFIILALLATHFLADFVFQSDWMAKNKSSNWWALLFHVCVYSIFFIALGWKFAVINGVLHFIVDAITSRITKRLWAKQQVHWFFVIIGFDQLIHYTCLLLTFNWLCR